MRVVLDECLPRKLGVKLTGHDVTTVPEGGLAGFVNGDLLQQLHGKCDAFVTVDKNLPSQHRTAALPFGVVVLRARSNRLEDLQPMIPKLQAALATIEPGQVTVVSSEPPSP